MELEVSLVEKDLDITKRALAKVKVVAPEKSYTHKIAMDFLNMAESYYKDAMHFHKEGNMVNAFACVNYAHGWLDAGARLGIFDVGGDDQLFTLME
ncbi:MAG: DUF357 domain-containing protein [Thermoplasmata archaeon]|nr:DUF357 domain-containing protein [Thermoplasmata archaeon]